MATPGQLQTHLDVASSGLAGMMYQPPKDMGDYWRQILLYQMHLQGSLAPPGASVSGMSSQMSGCAWPGSASAGLPSGIPPAATATVGQLLAAPSAPSTAHSDGMLHPPSHLSFSAASEHATMAASPSTQMQHSRKDGLACRSSLSQSGTLSGLDAAQQQQQLLQQQTAAAAGIWDAFGLMGLNPLLAAGLQGNHAAALQQQQQQLAAAASLATASSSFFSASSQQPTAPLPPSSLPSSIQLPPVIDTSASLMNSAMGPQLAASHILQHPLQPGSSSSAAAGPHPALAAAAAAAAGMGPHMVLGAGMGAGGLANPLSAAAAASAGLVPPQLMLGSLMGSTMAALAMAGMGPISGLGAQGAVQGVGLQGPLPPVFPGHDCAATQGLLQFAPQASMSAADQHVNLPGLPPADMPCPPLPPVIGAGTTGTGPAIPAFKTASPTPILLAEVTAALPPAALNTPFQNELLQPSMPAAMSKDEGHTAHGQSDVAVPQPPVHRLDTASIQPSAASLPQILDLIGIKAEGTLAGTGSCSMHTGPTAGAAAGHGHAAHVSSLAAHTGDFQQVRNSSGTWEPASIADYDTKSNTNNSTNNCTNNNTCNWGRMRASTSARSVCKHALQAGPKRARPVETDDYDASTADEADNEKTTDDVDFEDPGHGVSKRGTLRLQRRATAPGMTTGISQCDSLAGGTQDDLPASRITAPGWSSGHTLASCGSAGLPDTFRTAADETGRLSMQGTELGCVGTEDKQEKRKQSNRDSARRSRLRKQEEMHTVAERVQKMEQENPQLTAQVATLSRSAEQLDACNAVLRELLRAAKQFRSAHPSCMMPEEQLQPFLQRLQGCHAPAVAAHDASPAVPSAGAARADAAMQDGRQPGDQLHDSTKARAIRGSARKRQACAQQHTQAIPLPTQPKDHPPTPVAPAPLPPPPPPPAPLPPPPPAPLPQPPSIACPAASPTVLGPGTLLAAQPPTPWPHDVHPPTKHTGRLARCMGPDGRHDTDPAVAVSPPAACHTDPCGHATLSSQANHLLHSSGKTKSEPGNSMGLHRMHSTGAAAASLSPRGFSMPGAKALAAVIHPSLPSDPPLLDGFGTGVSMVAECGMQPQPKPPAGFVPVDATSTLPITTTFAPAVGQPNPAANQAMQPQLPIMPVGPSLMSQPPSSTPSPAVGQLQAFQQPASFMPAPLPAHSPLSLGAQNSAAGSGSSFAGPPMAFTPKMGLPAADYVGRQKAVAAAQAIAAAQAAAIAHRLRHMSGQTVTAGTGGSLGSLQGQQGCSVPSAPGSMPAGFLASPATTQATNPVSQEDLSDGPEANVGTSAAPPAMTQKLGAGQHTAPLAGGGHPSSVDTEADRLLHAVQHWSSNIAAGQHHSLADTLAGSQGSWLGLPQQKTQLQPEQTLLAGQNAANMPGHAQASLQLGQIGAGRRSSGGGGGAGTGRSEQGHTGMLPGWDQGPAGRSTTERHRAIAGRQTVLAQDGAAARPAPRKHTGKRRARSECSRSSQGSADGLHQSESEGETAGSPMTLSGGSAGRAGGSMPGSRHHHHHEARAAQSGGRLELPQRHSQEHASQHQLQHGASSRVDLLLPERSSPLVAPEQQPATSALLLCDAGLCNAGLGATLDVSHSDPLQLGGVGDGLETADFGACFATTDDQEGADKGFLGMGIGGGVDGLQTSGSEIDWSNMLQDSAGRNAASSALNLPPNMICSGFAQSADPITDVTP